MRIQIEVDQAVCQGHGVCQDAAPLFFEIRDDGFAYPTGTVTTPTELELVEDARSRCPVDAIRLIVEEA